MNSVKTFQTASRILIGPGSLNQIADEVKRLKGERVMIVTDHNLVKTGIVGRVEGLLNAAGISVKRFDDVEPDPPYQTAAQAAVSYEGNEGGSCPRHRGRLGPGYREGGSDTGHPIRMR